jgi:hypothetical protein
LLHWLTLWSLWWFRWLVIELMLWPSNEVRGVHRALLWEYLWLNKHILIHRGVRIHHVSVTVIQEIFEPLISS